MSACVHILTLLCFGIPSLWSLVLGDGSCLYLTQLFLPELFGLRQLFLGRWVVGVDGEEKVEVSY